MRIFPVEVPDLFLIVSAPVIVSPLTFTYLASPSVISIMSPVPHVRVPSLLVVMMEHPARLANVTELSTTSPPEDVSRSCACSTRPDAVPMLSRLVPEKAPERRKTVPPSVRPCPALYVVFVSVSVSLLQESCPALSVFRTFPEAEPSDVGKV